MIGFKLNWGLCFIIFFLILSNLLTHGENILTYDVFGAYIYLPKLFYDGNLHFQNLDWVNEIVITYKNTPTLYQFSWIDNQHYIIRYSCGAAILYLPFFLVGHLTAVLFGFPIDGFSAPYQWIMLTGSILVTSLGFYLLQKVLRNYFENRWVQTSIVCIFFGTNMTVQTGLYGLNVMSHNYLFMLYALLIYLSDQIRQTNQMKYWYLAFACSGLMALTRPVEILSIIIPFVWGGGAKFFFEKETYLWLNNFKRNFFALLILIGIGSIQFVYWYIETGHFLINSYNNPGEGLDLLNPHWIDYLFSYRKGWLVYTPLVLLCLFGFYPLYKSKRRIFYACLLTLIGSVYLASSWSNWWYSASFSSRAAIPSYALLCFPLAAVFQSVFFIGKMKRVYKYALGVLISLLVLLNLFQSYQFHKGIIDPQRMTKAAYFANFLSLERDPVTEWLLLKSRSEIESEDFDSTRNYQRRIIGYEDMEFGKDTTFVDSPVYEGKFAQKVASVGFSKNLWIPFNATTKDEYAFLKVSVYVYIPGSSDTLDQISLCAQMEYKDQTYFWRALNFEKLKLPKDQWNYVEFIYLTPEVRTREDIFKTFIWNRGTGPIYVDKLKIEALY